MNRLGHAVMLIAAISFTVDALFSLAVIGEFHRAGVDLALAILFVEKS